VPSGRLDRTGFGIRLKGQRSHTHTHTHDRLNGSDQAGVLEELDEDLVDKLVLGDGLHHQHPLLPETREHGGYLHRLGGREGERGGREGKGERDIVKGICPLVLL